MGSGAVAALIGTLAVALAFTPTDPHDRGKVGLDFIAFYTGGSFVRQGRSADLFDIRKVHQFQFDLAARNGVDLGNAVGPWWNPPFYAWVFVPISKLPYRDALSFVDGDQCRLRRRGGSAAGMDRFACRAWKPARQLLLPRAW